MKRIVMLWLCASSSALSIAQQAADPEFSQRAIVESAVITECEGCREPAVTITPATATGVVVYTNNILSYKQSISITTSPLKLIRKIKADLSYFEFIPESEDCVPCNKNTSTQGNFENSTLVNQVATGTGTHAISWPFSPPKNPGTYPMIINISLPPMVKCCTGTIRWCVRYIIEFDDCSVCSRTTCYEKKKTTSTPVSLPPANPTFQN